MYCPQLVTQLILVYSSLIAFSSAAFIQNSNLRGPLEEVEQRRLYSIWSAFYSHIHPKHHNSGGGSSGSGGSSGTYSDGSSYYDDLTTTNVDDININVYEVSNDYGGNGTEDGNIVVTARSTNSMIAIIAVGAAVGAVVAAVTFSRKRNTATSSGHPLSGSVPKRNKTFSSVMKHIPSVAPMNDFPNTTSHGIQSDFVRV